MPRKKEPSFKLKMLIWDKVATIGKKPEAILRELDIELQRFREEGKFYEDTPDVRTIKRIIERDINQLKPEVVIAKLPRYVWHLRDDYEAVEALAVTIMRMSPLPKDQVTTALIIASNYEIYRNEPAAYLGTEIDRMGERVFGGWWIGEDRAKLGDVDREVAAELLIRLKEEGEFPELADIENWKDLNDTKIADDFIQRLITRAHRGNF